MKNIFCSLTDQQTDGNPSDEVPTRVSNPLLHPHHIEWPCCCQSHGHGTLPDSSPDYHAGQHQDHKDWPIEICLCNGIQQVIYAQENKGWKKYGTSFDMTFSWNHSSNNQFFVCCQNRLEPDYKKDNWNEFN